MKKIQKKLNLKKKTISKLNKEQMSKVIGGCTCDCCPTHTCYTCYGGPNFCIF